MLLEKVVASPNIPHNSWTIRPDKFPGDRVLSSLTINYIQRFDASRRLKSPYDVLLSILMFFYVSPIKRFIS